jgi:hypothetical protein
MIDLPKGCGIQLSSTSIFSGWNFKPMKLRLSEVSLRLQRFVVIPKIVDENYFHFFMKIFHQICQHPLMIVAGRFGICLQSLKMIAKVANRFGWIDLQQLEDKLAQILARYLYPQQQQQQQQNTFAVMRCYG